MRCNLVILVVAGLATLASLPATAATCEPSSETRHSLKRLDIDGVFGDQLLAQQKAILSELLAQHPDDVFLNLRYEQMASATTDAERATAIARYKELADSHAGNPDYAFLYAASLVGFNTPDAIARLKALASGTPAYPLAFLRLSRIYSSGRVCRSRRIALAAHLISRRVPGLIQFRSARPSRRPPPLPRWQASMRPHCASVL